MAADGGGRTSAEPTAGARRLETVLRDSSDAVALCDADGRVVDCNQAAEAALGAASFADDIEGRRLLELLPDAMREEVSSAWERLRAGDEVTTAGATVQGTWLRLHLGAVVHHERLQGAVAVWRATGALPPAETAQAQADDLHRGIRGDELRLHYQPIVELSGASPVAMEALVRWQHPARGLIGPEEFIGLAERTGLVVELGDWVLTSATEKAAEWTRNPVVPGPPVRVAVNLSARQLRDQHLLASLQEALDLSGCAPEQLTLEVTETAVMAELASAARTLTELKDLGVGLAIDDFGTGYSSLLYLKHFPVDTIKIDRSFVSGLGRDADDTAIVAATVSLAHSVDVRCVAEGVETVEHLDLLRELGCDYAQGFLFSRPLDSAHLQEWFDLHQPAATELPERPPQSSLPTRVTDLLSEGASLHTIAAALNTEGSRTDRGTRWSARSVAHLLAGYRGEAPPAR